jgi:hypothetical protein
MDNLSAGRRLVSIPEARRELGGIGHSTLYELVNRGELVKVKIGRRGLITAQSIQDYVDRLAALAGADSTTHEPVREAVE